MKKEQRNKKKRLLRSVGVKFLFFVIGLFVSVASVSVYALWSNPVSPGDAITAKGWNEHVDKLIELDGSKVSCTTDLTNCIMVTENQLGNAGCPIDYPALNKIVNLCGEGACNGGPTSRCCALDCLWE